VNLGDIDRATDTYHLGMMRLKHKRERTILDNMYTATVSRLNPDPEWLKEQKERKLTLDPKEWMPDELQYVEPVVVSREEELARDDAPLTVEDLVVAEEFVSKIDADLQDPDRDAVPDESYSDEDRDEDEDSDHDEGRDEDDGLDEDEDGDGLFNDGEPMGVETALRKAEAALSEAQAALKKAKASSHDRHDSSEQAP